MAALSIASIWDTKAVSETLSWGAVEKFNWLSGLCGGRTTRQYRRAVMKIDERPIADVMGLLGKAAQGRPSGISIRNHSLSRQLKEGPDVRFLATCGTARSDEQKRALLPAYCASSAKRRGEPADNIFLSSGKGRGINFVEHGQHLPEFVEGNAKRQRADRPFEITNQR